MTERLRALAGVFIEECNKQGADVYQILKEILSENEDLKLTANEISKTDYFRIAEKIIRTEPTLKKKIPLPDTLHSGIEIFYIVHQKEYHNDTEFCEIVANELKLDTLNIRRSVLGNSYTSLRSGITIFLYKFQTEGEKSWHDNKISGRLRLLENAERKLFERIKAEL